MAEVGPSISSDLYTVARTLAVLTIDFPGFQDPARYANSLPPPSRVPLFVRYPSLYRFLLKATRSDPNLRFNSASEMAEQLWGVLRQVIARDGSHPAPEPSRLFTHELGADPLMPAWGNLPVPAIDPNDPVAGLLASLSAASPAQQLNALEQAAPNAEVAFQRARASLQLDDLPSAAAMVAAQGEADPTDWRGWWWQGIVDLAEEPARCGLRSLRPGGVAHELPGELAPLLATGAAGESDGNDSIAIPCYEVVASTDPAYASAWFGLARARRRAADRGGAGCRACSGFHRSQNSVPLGPVSELVLRAHRAFGAELADGRRPHRCIKRPARLHRGRRGPSRTDSRRTDRRPRSGRTGTHGPWRCSTGRGPTRGGRRTPGPGTDDSYPRQAGTNRVGAYPAGRSGQHLPASVVAVTCSSCGEFGAEGDRFCESCGSPLKDHLETDLGAVAVVSDRGRRHDRNEDAYCGRGRRLERAAMVVCDGVSMTVDPDRAAAAAAGAAIEILTTGLAATKDWPTLAAEAVAGAQDAVSRVPGDQPPESPASTTIVLALVEPGQIVVANVGDSRAYWVGEDGKGVLLTVDDSWVREAIDAGLPALDAYRNHRAHEITAWLGLDAGLVAPHVARYSPEAGGHLVVCSDGLWNYAESADDMASLVHQRTKGESLAIASDLVGIALAAGGAGQRDGRRGGLTSLRPTSPRQGVRVAPTFELECFQNEYLPAGGDQVDAIITVKATGTGVAGSAPSSDRRAPRAEVIIVDVSGSMHGEKLRQAKRATIAAIETIGDGVRFGIIAGNGQATLAFPDQSAGRRQAKSAPSLVEQACRPKPRAPGRDGGAEAVGRGRHGYRAVAQAGHHVAGGRNRDSPRHPAHRRQERE